MWSDGVGPMFLEGGDALVIGNGAVLVGMGERTHPAAVELLAQRLFRAEAATQVIAVEIPSQRSSMHLDTVLTMLDVDAFTVFPDARDAMTTYVVTPGANGLSRRGGRRPLRRDRPGARRAEDPPVRDRWRPLPGRA